VVGEEGDWLKLQLRNGSTGWIYQNFAQSQPEPVETPIAHVEELDGTSEPLSAQSDVTKESNSAKKVSSSMQRWARGYASLPKIARVRAGPSTLAATLQRIRRGTPLQVVGEEGDWLKLQLRNGSTGWIHHSLAQPEREPPTVLKGSNETANPLLRSTR